MSSERSEQVQSHEADRAWSHRVRRGLGAACLVAATSLVGYGGGMIAASSYPADVKIDDVYRAKVALSAAPSDASQIEIITTGGAIDVKFDSWLPVAPGITITPTLTDQTLNSVQQNRFDVESYVPSDEEIHQAIVSAAEQLAVRFGIGVAAAEALLLAGTCLYRRRRPTLTHIAAAATAGALAVGGISAQAAVHYQPDNYSTFTADGLLARLYDGRTLFDDIKTRSEQMEPFVTSLLTLSTELKQKFVSPEVTGEPAAKFLLVSDIHAVDQYVMMKKIIEEQGITAVIDAGDMTNFGKPSELDTSGFDNEIENLGVPYLFVRGNHDSDSPDDSAMLARLGQINNVILLQPSDDTYQEVSVRGITIAGFNDPRYYGDSNTNNDEKEMPAIDSFNRSFADREAPDIAVAHPPFAALGIDKAGLTINGHLHRAALEANHIQVGSFTAGGLFHHVPDEAGISKDQPYEFDILAIAPDCSPQSLTRFTFQSIIQGQPRFDSVAYVNGNQFGSIPEGDRQCGSEQGGVSSEQVPVLAANEQAAPTIPNATTSPSTASN